MRKLSLCLALFLMFLLVAHEALAQIEFLDGKLRVRGRLEQYMVFLTNFPNDGRDNEHFYRGRALAVNQSIFALEGLFSLVDNGTWKVNFQNYLRWYYESAPDFDSHLQRAFSSSSYRYKKYQTNRFDQDDWINEMYIDAYKGPWNIRLGKQVVVWSEVEMIQTIDKINPIDLRYATPGIQPFDELKLGLWMLRGFYNSSLPGNLIFEHIFIPGDFEATRTPFEGTWAARRPAPDQIDPVTGQRSGIKNKPGQADTINQLFYQQYPRLSISNYQYAFRIRGNSEVFLFKTPYILDWTVTYWNGLDTGHGTFEDTERANKIIGGNATGRLAGNPPPLPYGRDLGKWKRYEAVGAACQTYVPILQSVLRGELAYDIGRKWNKIDPGGPIDTKAVGSLGNFAKGTIERDYLSYGITVDKPLRMPFYGERMEKWGVRPYWDATFGVFSGYWIGGSVHRVWQWSNTYGKKSNTFLTLLIRGGLRHNEITPTLRVQYNTQNFGYISPGVSLMPGKHFRYEVGGIWFWAKDPADHREAATEDRDMIYARLRYEF